MSVESVDLGLVWDLLNFLKNGETWKKEELEKCMILAILWLFFFICINCLFVMLVGIDIFLLVLIGIEI